MTLKNTKAASVVTGAAFPDPMCVRLPGESNKRSLPQPLILTTDKVTPAIVMADLLDRIARQRIATGRQVPRALLLQAYRLQIEADIEQRFPDRKAVAA